MQWIRVAGKKDYFLKDSAHKYYWVIPYAEKFTWNKKFASYPHSAPIMVGKTEYFDGTDSRNDYFLGWYWDEEKKTTTVARIEVKDVWLAAKANYPDIPNIQMEDREDDTEIQQTNR